MGIVQKQGLIGSIILYIGIILGFILVVFLFPHYLEVSDFGVRSLMIDYVYILGQFSLFGLSAAGVRFFPRFKEQGLNKFFTFIIILFFVFFGIFYLFYVGIEDSIFNIFNQNSPQFARNQYLTIPLLLGVTFAIVLDMFHRVNLNTIFTNYVREIQTRILIISIVFLVGFSLISIEQFWVAFVVVYFINAFTLLFFIIKEHNIKLSYPREFLHDTTFMKEFIKFCLFTSLSSIGNVIVLKIDTMMIGKYISETNVGIYTLAIFLATLIDVPRKALIQMSSTIISNLWASKDYEEINSFYKKSSTNMQFAGTFIFLCIWLNIDDFFLLVPKGDFFATGKLVVFFIGLSKLLDMSFGVNGDIITFSKKYQIGLYFNLGLAALVIICNYLFIQRWGINGVAFGSGLALLIINLCRYLYIKHQYQLSPFSWTNIYLGLTLAIVTSGFHFIPFSFHPIINIGLKSFLVFLIFLFIVFKTNWVEDIKGMAFGILRKRGLIK